MSPGSKSNSSRAALLSDQNRVVELDDDDPLLDLNGTSHGVSIATSEAEARRELHRHLQEYSPVVATLNVEGDDDSSWSEGEYTDDDGYEIEENEYGMTNIRNELSDDYLKEMEELLKKHSPVIKNIGPSPEAIPEGILKPRTSMTAAQVATKSDPGIQPGEKGKTSKEANMPKKGVRFAEDLDVSPAPPPREEIIPSTVANQPTKPSQAPLSDLIVERNLGPKLNSEGKPARTKVSRFKAAKRDTANDTNAANPTAQKTTAQAGVVGDVLDRASASNKFSLNDEIDSYHQRMDTPERQIDRGLFTASEAVDDDDMDEGPRLSRFKASRLGLEISEHDSY